MTSYETVSVGLAIFSMVISTFSIKAAVAAKRSALAAETQADAAVSQARAAEDQLSLARAAYEASTRAQATAQLGVVGKAIAAINKHAAAAGTLSLEAVGTMDKSISGRRKIDPNFYAEVIATIPDIYPILTTDVLIKEWKALKAEFDVLQPYILLHTIEFVRSNVQGAMERHNTNAPKDMLDAFGRCVKLNRDLLAFARRLDV